ncbi:chromatin associated protein KTI12-domain-containing protein [Xylariaceae sp. FL0662B]|nr:chromatin associated protein KTI12-domain-containing protein [Xylariaceae sp. FL0662B]
MIFRTALMIAAYALLVLTTAVIAKQISTVEQGEKRLVVAVGLSLPFILVRLAYSAESAFGNGSTSNPLRPDIIVQLRMAIIMELVVVVIVAGIGLTLEKPPEAQTTSGLIIVTGLPTSGKTTRAKQLYTYLSERIQPSPSPSSSTTSSNGTQAAVPTPKYRLHLISDQTLSIPRSVYDLSATPAHARSANASEKDARASLYGAVKRVLSDRDIVVLDGLNYIKGWRYQLFCDAKAVRTPSCVLQIGCAPDRARAINEERLRRREQGDEKSGDEEEAPYEPENWENLVFRYEEPNPMTRWDSPLFPLIWEDDEEQTRQVFDKLWDAIAGEARKIVRPNQATVQRSRDVGGDYLYMLDRETQEIVKRILDQQSDDGGNEIKISEGGGSDEDDLVVELPAGKKVGLPQLQRLRRAFMALNRGGIGLEVVGNLGPGRIRESFVGYLNDAFEKDG